MRMSGFIERKEKIPRAFIELFPEDFADEWPEKPETSIKVGLRLVPEYEMHKARAVAADKAVKSAAETDVRVEIYNDTLMAWAVAEGTCSQLDVTEPWMKAAADVIPRALTSRGIRRIWEQLEQHHIESSPLYPEASADDLQRLSTRLVSHLGVENFTSAAAARLRKLASFMLSEFDKYDPTIEVEIETEEETIE